MGNEEIVSSDVQLPTRREMVQKAMRALEAADYGAIIPYQDWTIICGADARLTRTRSAILSAGRKVLRSHNKLLVNDRKIGYRIVNPGDQTKVSEQYGKRAYRILGRGLAAVVHVCLDLMTDEERNATLQQQSRQAILRAAHRNVAKAKQLPAPQDLEKPLGEAIVKAFAR